MLHYQRVGADTVGTTIATPEAVGTITIPSNATNVHAFIFQAGSTATQTTAEAVHGEFEVNPRSIGTQTFTVLSGHGCGAGAATNEGPIYDPGLFYLYKPTSGSVANEQVTFRYDALAPEPTTEMYVQAFLLSSNGGIDTAVLKNRGEPLNALSSYSNWSDTAWDADIGDVVSEQFANNISVPANVSLIHAITVVVNGDAVYTAGEHLAGYLTLSGTIPDLYPMDVPIPLQWATLGTNVDWGINSGIAQTYPLYIPGTGKNETINITANIAAATSGAMQVAVCLHGITR